MPGRLQTIETATLTWQVVAVRCRPSWIGPVTWRCHVVVVIGVGEWLREVVGIGGGGDEVEVVDDGDREGRVCLLTMCM